MAAAVGMVLPGHWASLARQASGVADPAAKVNVDHRSASMFRMQAARRLSVDGDGGKGATRMRVRSFVIGLVGAAMAAMGAPASAAVTTYVGEDLIATAAPPAAADAPNSLAARTAFLAATGPATSITFEGAPLGAFSSLTAAPGVTVTGTDVFGVDQTVRNTTNFPSYPSVDGFNTTAGGSYFIEVKGGSLTFSFLQPINAFGLYLSGVQTNFFADRIQFFDGANQQITLAGVGTSCCVGELAFVGFTDPDALISSVTILASLPGTGADFIGVDDVVYRTAATGAVPEPATWATLLLGFATLGAALRAQRRATARPRTL